MANSEAEWTKDIPRKDDSYVCGWYWMRRLSNHALTIISVNQHGFYWDIGRLTPSLLKDVSGDYEYLPASPSDAEQLIELRKETLKGICVYCGEIQQYESLEQKSGEEGNQIRVAHIRQCPQRPELKLIAYCEELQEAANAAFKCLCGTGDKTIDQVKDQIYKVLNPKQPQKEPQ